MNESEDDIGGKANKGELIPNVKAVFQGHRHRQ